MREVLSDGCGGQSHRRDGDDDECGGDLKQRSLHFHSCALTFRFVPRGGGDGGGYGRGCES